MIPAVGARVRARVRPGLFALGFAWMVGTASFATPQEAPPSGYGAELERILAGLDHTAALYQDNALRFTCDETIVHDPGQRRRVYRYRYVYRYEEGTGLQDFRMLRTGDELDDERLLSRKKLERRTRGINLGEETELSTWVSRAYSWIFLFERRRRDLFDFSLGPREEILGRPAVRLDFTPRPPYVEGVNNWVGSAWVDVESVQLLRVSALDVEAHRAREEFERNVAEAPGWDRTRESAHQIYSVETEYGVQRQGLRFPTEVLLQASEFVVRGGRRERQFVEYPSLTVRQSYENYRIFDVRTLGEPGRYPD